MYFFWQQNGGEEAWQEALADDRRSIITAKRPRYATILDVSAVVTESSTREEIAALKYLGPLYFDFDGPDIETVLPKFRQFLDKLQQAEVDLHSLRLSATGGRGFHVLIPMEALVTKIPKQGVQNLPLIYKEFAFELFVDTLDLRVYSGRKGRMFRVENSLRENGKYKVPLTVDEALNMTVEDYNVLCSAPRQLATLTPPVLNQKLAVMYAKAEQKIIAASKRKKDSSKDLALLTRFKGGFPPSLLAVMAGEGTADGMGFHPIAMQVAITSNALGKAEDEVLALCEGLIANHQSDGSRYNTPQKRRAELQRMLRYTQDNVCYTYSKDAVRKLVPAGKPSLDLDGMPEGSGAVMQAEGEDSGLLGGVVLTEQGIYRKGEDGMLKISDIAFKDVVMLADAESGSVLGYESDLKAGGVNLGRCFAENATFLSRANFQRFVMAHRSGFTGNDNHVVAVSFILRDAAMANGGTLYCVNREGLDLIPRPDSDGTELDFLWVSHERVDTESPIQYRHRGMANIKGSFHSDLMDAPDLVDSEEARAVIHSLLNLNTPFVTANVLGWMVSAFHRQVYHRLYRQFPLLSVFGAAGSGKSSLIRAFMGLHYYKQEPLMELAVSSTKWAVENAVANSASIPYVLDEYKPREMQQGRHAMLKNIMRGAYNSETFSKGGMGTELGQSWKDVRTRRYSSPIVFIGEALESETAMMERSLQIPVQKANLDGRRDHHRLLLKDPQALASLGKQIVRATFALNFDTFRERFEANEAEVGKLAFKQGQDRPTFNLAVVMTGLDFFGLVLHSTFGEHFDQQIAALKLALGDVSMQVATSIMSEASKALNMLALISQTEEPDSELGLREGREYCFHDENHLDIKVRHAYVKLAAWCRRKGQMAHYDNEEAFVHGLAHDPPLKNKACLDSALKSEGTDKVFRFDLTRLTGEGVERFRDDPRPSLIK